MPVKSYTPYLLKKLSDPEYAVEYLSEVIENESLDSFMIALKHVVDARGENMTALAENCGITRQGLYNLLSKEGNPRLSTLHQLLNALGMKIKITGNMVA
jgi:probable addiction module antidote protein